MQNIVPEILCEITSYLHYTDIIGLNLVCKRFKSILTKKITKIKTWYNSRAEVLTVKDDRLYNMFGSVSVELSLISYLQNHPHKNGDLIDTKYYIFVIVHYKDHISLTNFYSDTGEIECGRDFLRSLPPKYYFNFKPMLIKYYNDSYYNPELNCWTDKYI